MPDLRQHLQTATSTLRASESTRARQLEHQLLVAHRELSALQNDFLDLGLQASLYARERDAARDRLRRTEQYLDSSLSDGDTRRVEAHSVGGPCFPDARTGHSDIKPINWFIPGNTARWEILLNTVKDYLTPRSRLIEGELQRVRGDAKTLGDRYLELADRANTLAAQRDAVLAALERAHGRTDTDSHARPATSRSPGPQASEPAPDSTRALADKLHRTQNEKNDITIQLAESEDRVRDLQAEQARLLEEISTLNRQLALTENHRAADQQELLALSARLEQAATERATTDTGSQQQIDALRKRTLELELQLAAARKRTEVLEQRLSEAHREGFGVQGRSESPVRQVDQIPRPAAASGDTAPDRNDKPFKWTRLVTGLVFLLGLLASAGRLWETGHNELRRAAVSKDLQRGTAEADDGRTVAKPAPPAADTEIAALETPPRPVGVQTGKPASPLSRQAKNTLAGGSGPFLAKHRSPRATLHSHSWLMGDGSSMAWAGQPCRDRGLTEEACERLKKNMFEEGVVRLADGVQYTVLNNGTGASPGPHDTVLVNYRGMLLNGQAFDSSRQQGGDPVRFRLDETIAGLQSALQQMEVGARWKLYIPGDLAFKKPAPHGGETLIFDLELVAIETPAGDRSGAD